MKVIIINGPNLNLLGKREPSVYGSETFEDYFMVLQGKFPEIELTYFQSNDAIKGVETPVVEVHISNVYQRESFRHKSYIAPNAIGIIAGFGLKSYELALRSFLN